ncbi:MAG: toprim domain-containing protein [Candidatus Hermodarchaeota archaeon]
MCPHQKSPQSKRERLEERFERGIRLLLELSEEGVPIVVEGIKDITALRGLGLTGPIHVLAGHNIVSLADELAEAQRLLILFDFDRRGGQLTRHLIKQLEGRGVTLLHNERHQLKRAFGWRVRVIEGLKEIDNCSKGTKF